jgi:hypothetical protein
MKRFMSKKLLVVGVAVALVLGIGGAAFAYWTTTGSGTGSAQTGTASNVLINQIGTPAYNSTMSALSGYVYSQAFNGPQLTEFGNEVNLAYTGPLTNAVVAMANLTGPQVAFTTSITFNVYSPSNLTTPLTSDTENIAVPSCPPAAATVHCTAGGHAVFDATFSNFKPAVVLPSTVVYGITLNQLITDGSTGNDSASVGSLNVDLSTEATNVTVGSDTNPGDIFVQSLQADAGVSALESNLGACSGAPAGVLSTFQAVPVQCSAGYGLTYNIPAVELNVGVGDLYPGGPALPISFSVTNPGSSAVLVSTVSIGIAQDSTLPNPQIESIAGDSGSYVTGCYADWFQINGSPVTVNQTIPAGGTIDWVGAASIQMNNYDTNQDLCENTAVGLTFTSP